MNFLTYNYIKFFLLILLINCASQAPPSGGPVDSIGPKVNSIQPAISQKLNQDESIYIIFDELLDPKTIINAVSVHPEIKIKVSCKNYRLSITPYDYWPNKSPLELIINRSISDYRGNKIGESIQLIYNVPIDEYKHRISGSLVGNYDERIYQLGLYAWPLSNNSNPIKIIQSDDQGSYEFNFLKPGKYIIFATADKILNPYHNIRNNFYALSNDMYINVVNDNKYKNLYIDKPLFRNKIEEIECINSNYFILHTSNGNIIDYIPNDNHYVGDTISMKINMKNQSEEYTINIEQYIIPNFEDTIPPSILSSYSEKGNLFIEFSEPLKIKQQIECYDISSEIEYSLDYKKITPKVIKFEAKNIEKIKILGSSITDLSDNNMIDSIKVINFNYIKNDKDKKIQYSNSVRGKIARREIDLTTNTSIALQAININSKQTYTTINNHNKFQFNNLEPGKYIIWAFYIENEIDLLRYFSGTLEPYKPSSQFTFLQDTIEVRKNWDIEDVLVNFY